MRTRISVVIMQRLCLLEHIMHAVKWPGCHRQTLAQKRFEIISATLVNLHIFAVIWVLIVGLPCHNSCDYVSYYLDCYNKFERVTFFGT